jgi:DUF4097 and DUF4098 domain-containing protein YvlB
MRKFWIIILLALMPAVSWAKSDSRTFDASGITSLSVISTSGDVTITATSGGTAKVVTEKKRFPKDCTISMGSSGGILMVEVSEPRWPGNTCTVNLDLRVPAKLAQKVKIGSGDLRITGTTGSLDFKLGSGDVTLNSAVTDLDGSSGSGNIRASDLRGSVDLKMGAGDIILTYPLLPDSGTVNVKNGSGDTTVILPAGSVILTNLTTGSGRTYNELGDSAGAPFKIDINTGSGKLSIRRQR